MREDFPGISTRNPRKYGQLYRDENRERIRKYNCDYQRKRRARLKRLAKKKNGK